MPTMTPETFERILQKQRPNKDIVKLRDLEEGTIYKVVGKETIKTKNGDTLVIILDKWVNVGTCSSLAKRLGGR